MDLLRMVVDKEIVDCDGFKAGKVDDLLLEVRPGEPPIVRAILTQHGALASLMGARIQRAALWLRRHVLGFSTDVGPVRIGWEHVKHIDVVVHLDVDRRSLGVMDSEEAIWQRWIKPLPFSER